MDVADGVSRHDRRREGPVRGIARSELECSFRAGADAYRAGFEAAFVKRPTVGPGASDAEAAAIATREQVWTDKLVELLSRGKRVANIVGPTGIAARLERSRYVVTRVAN